MSPSARIISVTLLCALALSIAGPAGASPRKARRIRRLRTPKGHRLLSIDGMVVLNRSTLMVKSNTNLDHVGRLGGKVTHVKAAKHGYVKVTFEPKGGESLLARMGRIVERANQPRDKRAAKPKKRERESKRDSYAPAVLDHKAKSEMDSIPVGKRKAFVYGDRQDAIAVGNSIHLMLAMEIAPNMQKGVAGFIERTPANHYKIIHWPSSPVDFSSPELLRAVQRKLTKLGYSVTLERKAPRR